MKFDQHKMSKLCEDYVIVSITKPKGIKELWNVPLPAQLPLSPSRYNVLGNYFNLDVPSPPATKIIRIVYDYGAPKQMKS